MSAISAQYDGLDIITFSRRPLVASKWEVAISSCEPKLESNIFSFNDYEDALDFCKKKKTVGLLLAHDDGLSPSILDVSRELLKPYEQTGWPAFYAVVHEKEVNALSYRLLLRSDQMLAVCDKNDFESKETLSELLAEMGSELELRSMNRIVSIDTMNTLEKIYEKGNPGSLGEYGTIVSELCRNVRISWRDRFALQNRRLFEGLLKENPDLIEELPFVSSMSKELGKIKGSKFSDLKNKELSTLERLVVASRIATDPKKQQEFKTDLAKVSIKDGAIVRNLQRTVSSSLSQRSG